MTEDLPSGWTRKPLSEFIVLQRGFDLAKRKRRPGHVKVLSSGDVSGWHDEARVSGPGFVVGRATNIGRPTWSDEDYWPLNTVLYAKDFQGNEPKYAYYWFLANDLTAYNSGSVQAMLNRNYIANVPVDVPPLAEQRAIAATLGALDDRIESCQRVASVALDLAEAIYLKSCMQGSLDLPLRDAGTWLSGGTPSTSSPDFWDGELPWISAASLKDFFIWNSERRLSAAGVEAATNIVPEGSLLMIVRGMSLKTEFRFGVAQRRVAFGQDCKAIIPKIPSSMLALALRASRHDILKLVDEAGHGTGRLSTDLLTEYEIEVPDDASVTRTLDALLSRGAVAKAESHELASLRDALLPGLLSGEIRVAEASTEVRSVISRGDTA